MAALAVAQPAIAEFETLINAVETAPANIIIPASNNGMMTFRPCADECDRDYERVRVTPETKFSVDGARVKWEDFSKVFPAIRQGDRDFGWYRTRG